ncbi:MAG: hypothetical protein A2Z88_11235 [Omnitrophica WOR_2 bacterium GWA2_47_8]|nr:MAG: hypothetical protein A2Z88_11235 [Omnitrophica WOR_2 bacterium GWA2_47_8]
MPFSDFMSKIRQWDVQTAKWINRHFYLLFFEIILAIIFVAFFVNSLKVIDFNIEAMGEGKLLEKILISQSVNLSFVVMLLLLNSFWILFMFNSILRISASLRELNYVLGKRRNTDS